MYCIPLRHRPLVEVKTPRANLSRYATQRATCLSHELVRRRVVKRHTRGRDRPRGYGGGGLCRAIVSDEKDLAPWRVRCDDLVQQADQLRTRVAGRTHPVHVAEDRVTHASAPPLPGGVYIMMRDDETSGQTGADVLGITRATVQTEVAQVWRRLRHD